MRKSLFSVSFLLALTLSMAQTDMAWYLPDDVTYNPEIPTPRQVLGYEVGDWHVSHDQLAHYMRTLDEASDRIKIDDYARTYEGRPLMVLIITSPQNFGNLEEIRRQHVSLTDPGSSTRVEDTKLVHWMGYSVHGNEASGSNAALLTAYFLAAAQGPRIDRVLEEAVILLDPSFNPDGLQRFSTWVNMHKSANLVSDPASREYHEVWPGGRTNHYWFDLNRDWLPVQHPESRGRIGMFHKWKPNVLTDHHEMGSGGTFFFQPGIPSRKNPLTPELNVTMTARIASYHAAALDSIGSLYYSEESFDDYYIGKGSTYPDINGAIGILFEQASARGHVQETPFGKLEFPFAIRNHFVTSLSTLRAAMDLKQELLQMQQDFYRESMRQAAADPVKAFVFGSEKDPVRAFHLMDILRQHQIDVYKVKNSITKSGKVYSEGSYIVPTSQAQYRLIKAVFETRTTFQDSLFYDVSTWTLPLAFNLNYAALGREFASSEPGEKITRPEMPRGVVTGSSDYAYIFEPYGYHTQRAIMRLLDRKILTQVAHAVHSTEQRSFARGSIIVPVGIQAGKKHLIDATVQEIAESDGINVYALSTGLAASGVDLGSPQIDVLEKPKVVLLVGEGVSSYEAGEVWHLLDQRCGMQVTLLPTSEVGSTDLNRYNRLIMPGGSYSSLGSGATKIRDWLTAGGVIVTWKSGGKWLADQKLSKASYKKSVPDTTGYKRYVDLVQNRGAQVIGGAIFKARLDLGHPLTYGLESNEMPLFRDHTLMLLKAANPYANPLVYTADPLLSGYISEARLADLRDTPAATISDMGKGKIITFADNPNFRAFWYGTNKLFLNALFFGQTISAGAAE